MGKHTPQYVYTCEVGPFSRNVKRVVRATKKKLLQQVFNQFNSISS